MTDQNKVYLLYGFIVLLGLCSCRSVQTEKEVKELAKVEIRDEMVVEWEGKSSVSEEVQSLLLSNEDIHIDLTLFAPPDSCGHQPVKAKATITNRRVSQSATVDRHNKEDTLTANIHENLNVDKNKHVESVTKVSKNSKFLGLKLAISIGFLFILIFIIYKKWRHFELR